MRAIGLAVVLVYFAVVGLWGYVFLRSLCPDRFPTPTLLAPGLVLGICTQLVFLNLLSYILPPPASFPVALLLQLGTLAWPRLRGALRPSPLGGEAARYYLLVAALVGLTFACRAFGEFQLDNFRQHWPNIATIAAGNFPVRDPHHPSLSVGYHYGTELISAQIMWLSRLPVFAAPQYLKTAFVVASVVGVMGIVHRLSGSLRRGIWAALAFYAFAALPELVLALGSSGAAEELTRVALEEARGKPFIHFAASSLFVQSVPAGFAALLSIAHLLELRAFRLDAMVCAALMILLCALALLATPEFALAMAALALFVCIPGLGVDRRRLAAVLGLALGVAAIQGGVLTDLWLHPQPGPGEYAFRWPPGLAFPGARNEIYPMFTGRWWTHLFLDTDLLVLLVPVALASVVASRGLSRCLVGSIVLTGFAASQLVSYKPGEFNTNRFLAVSLQMSWVLVFTSRFELSVPERWRRPARAGVLGVVALGCLPYVAYSIASVAQRLGLSAPSEPSYLGPWDDASLLEAGAWLPGAVRANAVVASNDPGFVVALTGRFAPSREVVSHGFQRDEGLSRDPSTWTLAMLDRSGVDTVCLFRSHLFEAGGLDVRAVQRDLEALVQSQPRVYRLLVGRLVGPEGRTPAGAARVFNNVIQHMPGFAAAVDRRRLGLDQERRVALVRALDSAGSAWTAQMIRNRFLLRALFPAGTRQSGGNTEAPRPEALASYPWYRELEESRPILTRDAYPAGSASDPIAACIQIR